MYDYNCSILFLVIALNRSPCLIYKLKFITCRIEKNIVYIGFGSTHGGGAAGGGCLAMYSPQIRGDCYTPKMYKKEYTNHGLSSVSKDNHCEQSEFPPGFLPSTFSFT